jgi:hypothetical protein
MSPGAQFFIEHLVRFFEYIRITGGLYVKGRTVSHLKVIGNGSILAESAVNLDMDFIAAMYG